jgi:hypothetical protein
VGTLEPLPCKARLALLERLELQALKVLLGHRELQVRRASKASRGLRAFMELLERLDREEPTEPTQGATGATGPAGVTGATGPAGSVGFPALTKRLAKDFFVFGATGFTGAEITELSIPIKDTETFRFEYLVWYSVLGCGETGSPPVKADRGSSTPVFKAPSGVCYNQRYGGGAGIGMPNGGSFTGAANFYNSGIGGSGTTGANSNFGGVAYGLGTGVTGTISVFVVQNGTGPTGMFYKNSYVKYQQME